MENTTKINRGKETHCMNVCTKFDQFILIYEAMNVE